LKKRSYLGIENPINWSRVILDKTIQVQEVKREKDVYILRKSESIERKNFNWGKRVKVGC
jgi:hypothetical protein